VCREVCEGMEVGCVEGCVKGWRVGV
jgi:hypothetical protein